MARLTSVSTTLVPGMTPLCAHPAASEKLSVTRAASAHANLEDFMKLGYHLASFVPPAKARRSASLAAGWTRVRLPDPGAVAAPAKMANDRAHRMRFDQAPRRRSMLRFSQA